MRYDVTSLINTNTIFLSVNNVFNFTLINSMNVNINLINVANKSIVIKKINYNQFLVKIYKL